MSYFGQQGADIDPAAFVVITEANEVPGEGLKPVKD